jgi:hypothetical protein
VGFFIRLLALLAAKEGKGECAVELWALASRVSVIVTSRFYQDLYRQRIAPIVEALPADVVAAAEARGRSRDIWAALEESSAEMGGSSHAAGPF